MKVYTYKGIIFTIEKNKIGYQCKAEQDFTILKQTYIDYTLHEVKKRFKLEIKKEFIFDDYQKEQYKIKTYGK